MSRTANSQRPRELHDAIANYLIKHGLTGLSLRPLAKVVGSSPRMLLYYFGSKEKMIAAVIADIRQRQRAAYETPEARSFAEACWIIWKRMSAPESEPHFRLYFEIYGMALRHPKQYKDFLHETVEDWLREVAAPLRREGHTRAEARAFATVMISGLRGFMLDFCTTRDRRRLNRAVNMWLSRLDTMLPSRKGV
jgi:AcrR family transcriptional regulator